MQVRATRVDRALQRLLPRHRPGLPEGVAKLHEAMRYSVFAGGKRVRPVLVLAACDAVRGDANRALPVACAVELIHTYSLIHDDLPSMDDSALRRGKPTCHRAFSEAVAILAGDALLTLAFDVLVRNPSRLPPGALIQIVAVVAHAAGPEGMVAGQAWDIVPGSSPLDARALRELEGRKTGALIRACVVCGAIAGGAHKKQAVALDRYGRAVGLAFQIMDDVLDATSTPEQLGKDAGQDRQAKKTTFADLLGVEAARRYAGQLSKAAVRALHPFGREADPLRAMALWAAGRRA
ncbi:MAG: polyprenyl synthetase family protein [Nitrospirae bacterium]|nr:polyprenyl synthetase family protein [Nitrospirota bacterium]